MQQMMLVSDGPAVGFKRALGGDTGQRQAWSIDVETCFDRFCCDMLRQVDHAEISRGAFFILQLRYRVELHRICTGSAPLLFWPHEAQPVYLLFHS